MSGDVMDDWDTMIERMEVAVKALAPPGVRVDVQLDFIDPPDGFGNQSDEGAAA
jgi:hypothetical protein